MDLKKAALRAHPSQLGEEIIAFAEEMGRWGAAGQEDLVFAESFHRIILERPAAASK